MTPPPPKKKKKTPPNRSGGAHYEQLFSNSCFLELAKFRWKYICWSLFLTTLQISRPETSWKRDSGTDIFLWIFHNFSKNLIYRTPVANCSCWFLHSNQSFIHWSHFVHFFFHFFSFIIDNCNYGSVLRKCLKMKNFLLFTIVFYFLCKCCSYNFAFADAH